LITIIIVLFILIIAVWVYKNRNWMPDKYDKQLTDIPRLQNHRGYREEGAIENTLQSYRQSLEKGYGMVELDVRLSGDGIPVVFHDKDLKRLVGVPDKLRSLTADQLKEKAGVSSLAEVLSDDRTPQWINVELKSSDFFSRNLVIQVIEVIKSSSKRIVVSSYDPFILYHLRRQSPKIPRALLVTFNLKDVDNNFWRRKMWFMFLCKPDFIHMDYKYLNEDFILKMKQKGVLVATWVVNDVDKAVEQIKSGVVSIITDRILEKDLL